MEMEMPREAAGKECVREKQQVQDEANSKKQQEHATQHVNTPIFDAGPAGCHQSEELSFTKRGGFADFSGQKYEYKMAALLLLRGVNHTDGFYLGTNVDCAGAFDDVIFKYKPRGEREYRTCFIQCKHNVKGNKIINISNLADANDDHGVYKYYKSFCELEKKINDLGAKCVLFDVDFERCDFVFYSNSRLDRSLATSQTDDSILERAKLFVSGAHAPALLSKSKLTQLKSKIAENMDKPKIKNKSEFVKFHEVIDSDHMSEFLDRFQWFTQQATEDELDALIGHEIKMALRTSEEDTVKMAKMLVERVQVWWEEPRRSQLLTESAQLWGDVVVALLNSHHVKRKDINFTDQEIDSFNQTLSSSLVINVTSQHGNLTGLKINQMLEKHHSNRYIYVTQTALLSRKPEVLLALKNTWCDVMVIECSTDAESLAESLSKALSGKKLILLSESALPGYQPLKDNFSWSQLKATSQQRLLEKKVDFQGCDVSLGSVVGEHCTHALTGEVVTTLISPGAKLALGKKTPDNISYYIPRSLERFDYINKEVFSQTQREIFIISNVEEQDVHSLEDSYRVNLKKFDENEEVLHHFFWTDNLFNADKFTRFCQKIPDKNVHWLSVDQSNLAYWKQSVNNMDVIKINIDSGKKRIIEAEDLKDVNERVVLVAAEPGMGKTTYLNNVAQSAKAQDSTLYMLRIDLNNITTQLSEHDEQYFSNQENITDFIIDVTKNCELDIEILQSRLTKTGSVCIYLDGYDEISPYYNDKVTNMIKSMMKLKVEQIWLTSRNVMRHHLESKLASICYTMKPFTDEDQSSFLVKLWNAKHSIQINDSSRVFAQNLLKKASESFSDRDREFTGIPLQCMMLGEVFAKQVELGELNLPNRLDLLQLFETFISDKLNILNEGKDQLVSSNPRQIARKKREQRIMMENHSEAAIILLLSDKEIESLKENKRKMSSNVEECFSVGEEAWKGLVDGLTDGKPSFIHRCFAEYFLAWWLSENILSSTYFIAQNLFQPRFVTVRQFLDLLLARDCRLHNAVLSADREQVEALLISGADVNQLDKCGRSALHLASSYPDDDSYLGFDLDTAGGSIMQVILTYKADVNLKERILLGTPLRYADKTKLWGKVDHLLRNGANTDGLVEMRELINNMKKRVPNIDEKRIRDARETCYSIIKHACFHLLQFVVDECGLEVNTKLTSIKPAYQERTLLHAAAESGDEDSVKFLLDRGADMMKCDEDSYLPIHLAAQAGYHVIIQLLIKSDINAKGYRDFTPLHEAANSGHLNTVQLLVDAGAELNAKTNAGVTPLHIAVMGMNVEVVKCLIEYGADVNAMDFGKRTALDLADTSGISDVVRLLIDAGAEYGAKIELHKLFMYQYQGEPKSFFQHDCKINKS